MNKAVLDTDTLSAIMRQDPIATSRAQAYLTAHSRLTISIITRFEILRGLNAKNASAQIAAFHAMCHSMEVLPITDDIVVFGKNDPEHDQHMHQLMKRARE